MHNFEKALSAFYTTENKKSPEHLSPGLFAILCIRLIQHFFQQLDYRLYILSIR